MTFTKKELQIFWGGISIGIIGAILGNLFTSLWTSLLISELSKFWWGKPLLWITFGIIFLITIFFILWVGNKLKKINKIKRGRPKRK
jgi:H+/Cl- antiporter ClcA